MWGKKTILSASLVLAVAAYAGATWYVGQRVRADYEETVAKVREALGTRAVVVDEYQRGFFSSRAKLALQWPSAEDIPEALQGVQLVVDSQLRHGPLAGARLAAAVVDSRVSLQGLSDENARLMAKATGPTLTTVRHLTGGADIRLLWPAGEVSDAGATLRWQEMVTDAALSSDYKQAKGNWRWPEFSMSVAAADHGEDEDEGAAAGQAPAEPAARNTITFKGVEGDFTQARIDGLWLMATGTSTMRVARGIVSGAVTGTGGAQAQTLMDLKNLVANVAVAADGGTLGFTTKVQAAGTIGPMEFESIGFEEKFQRLDVEALRNFQNALGAQFQGATLEDAMQVLQEQGLTALMQNAPRLVAALPAYSMKLQATYQGQTSQIEYGAEVQSAPSADEVEKVGWGPALLMTSVLHASVQIPKASLAPLFKAVGQAELPEDQLNTMIGAAHAAGYLVQEGEQLTSKLRMQAGQPMLNGKPFELPMNLLGR